MKHRLTFKDDKSDKFWNIEVGGTSFTVTYGKTGTKKTQRVRSLRIAPRDIRRRKRSTTKRMFERG
ncbi:WGR domain protein [Leptospira santarosai str. HAI1349]|nr:WGR domain protein [Leptospira santarosai str. HAI1349]